MGRAWSNQNPEFGKPRSEQEIYEVKQEDMKANLTSSTIWPQTGHTLTPMCPALPKIKRPHRWRLWLQQSQCLTVSEWGHLSFGITSCLLWGLCLRKWITEHPIPLPRVTWHFQIEAMRERGRQREKNREIITQVCFDFQKWVSMHADKILAAGGTTLDSDRLLEQEGEIRSRLRGETLINTDRPQSVRMWFTRCFK